MAPGLGAPRVRTGSSDHPAFDPFDAFVAEIFERLPRADQRRWAHVYTRGLLLTPGRKTVRRLAASVSDSDTAAQALHQFVNASPWDWEPVRARLADWVARRSGPRALLLGTAVLPKRGDRSCGVHRRFVPQEGRTVNCQVGIGAFLAGDRATVPVDWRLLLPGAWSADPKVRDRARVPEDAAGTQDSGVAQALALVDGVLPGSGTDPDGIPVVADLVGFADTAALVAGLVSRRRRFVLAVPGDLTVLPDRTVPGASRAPAVGWAGVSGAGFVRAGGGGPAARGGGGSLTRTDGPLPTRAGRGGPQVSAGGHGLPAPMGAGRLSASAGGGLAARGGGGPSAPVGGGLSTPAGDGLPAAVGGAGLATSAGTGLPVRAGRGGPAAPVGGAGPLTSAGVGGPAARPRAGGPASRGAVGGLLVRDLLAGQDAWSAQQPSVVSGVPVRLPGIPVPLRLTVERRSDEAGGDRFWLTDLVERPAREVPALARLHTGAADTLERLADDFGLRAFEGRSYPGWHHHMTLVSAAFAYGALGALGRAGTPPTHPARASRGPQPGRPPRRARTLTTPTRTGCS
ncbi:IS701 family transposase [Streptomyces sp. NPDC003015]